MIPKAMALVKSDELIDLFSKGKELKQETKEKSGEGAHDEGASEVLSGVGDE